MDFHYLIRQTIILLTLQQPIILLALTFLLYLLMVMILQESIDYNCLIRNITTVPEKVSNDITKIDTL